MKKVSLILLLLLPISLVAQLQDNAPWSTKLEYQKKEKVTIENIAKSAEQYFSTIDRNKKGSGLKPFERWKYHWSYYLNEDRTIATSDKLWKAWEEKKARKNSSKSNSSNWTSLGPYSHTNTASWSAGQGRVNTIAVDPNNSNTYYVGAPAGGIWKSTDAGVNWSPLTDYLPQIGVSGIAIKPSDSNVIYIATGDDDANDSYSVGVMKSIDGGATWNATGNIPGNPNSMNEIYIDPNNHETILVATSFGVMKSTDGGANWTSKLTANIIDLKMKPGDATTWYAVSGDTFYRSTDSGESFTSININGFSGSSRLVIDVTPANANYVYMVSAGSGSSFNGVYRSINSGASFTKMAETDNIFESTQAWYDLALAVSDTNPNTIFVGVLNIWRSNDGGNNFTKINNWSSPNADSYTHADIHFMRYFNGKFFAGTDGGIYVSTNDGTKFTDLTENLAISQFYKISVASQNSGNIVGGLQDNGGYAYHENNWNNYFGADGMDCAVNALKPETYYGFIQYGGSLYETNDGGKTRKGAVSAPSAETGPNDSGGRWVTPMASNSQGVIYSGYSQLYKLENGAWVKVSNHSFGGDLYLIEIDTNNDDIIYVSRAGSLYRSTNRGVTFTLVPFSSGTINAIEISHTDSNVGWVATNIGVYKSTNLNASNPTFTILNNGAPSEGKLTLKHHTRSGKNTVYLGTTLGVYYINDEVNSWQIFDTNLPNVAVRDLEINEEDSKLYAATYGRGVFVTNIPVVVPDNDVRLLSLKDPNNTLSCVSNIAPKITIKNQGSMDLTSATVTYSYDGGASNNYAWTGSLSSNATAEITLPTTSLNVGTHTLQIEVTTNGDAYSSNNSISGEFIVNNFNNAPTTTNTFESASDNLLVETTTATDLWKRGIPSKTLLNTVGSGSQAYVTALSGNYPNSTTSYLYTKCYDLTQITTPVLKFKMAFDIEQDWDHMYVEYSTDQGATWSILGTAGDSNWYNSFSTANGLPGKQWTGEGEDSHPSGGTNATLRDYSYDLAAFKSESSMVFRFKFVADAGVNEEGVLIDDIVIGGVLPVDEFDLQNKFSIQPNPSNGIFNITWKSVLNLDIKVYDVRGRLIKSQKETENNSFNLDMSGYTKGIYFVKLNSGNKFTTKKIILN